MYKAPYKNTKKVHDNQFLLHKQSFLHPFLIFESFVTFIILSTDLLIHGQTFNDSHKNCGLKEGGKVAVTGASYREINSKIATAPKLKVEDKDNSRRIKW